MKTVCSYLMIGFASAVLNLALSSTASADINKGTHLNTSGQTKVNRALARGYQKSGDTDGYTRQQQKTQVNIGSKRAGNCTMNVGSTEPGKKGSKEVIVTSKEIINVCK